MDDNKENIFNENSTNTENDENIRDFQEEAADASRPGLSEESTPSDSLDEGIEENPEAQVQKDEDNLDEQSFLPVVVDILEEEELSELEIKKAQANKVILGFTLSAGATGAIPLPLADTPLLIAQQVAMIAKLSDIYGLNMKKSGLKSLVFTVLGVSGTTVLGKTITSSLFKLIPGIGTVGGAAICGTTGAALTAALGKAYSEVCQSVLLGELDEDDLLKVKGRKLLETSFKNHLRLELDQNAQAEKDAQDVLKQESVPQDHIPVHLSGKAEPETKQAESENTGANPLNETNDSKDGQ